MIQIILAGLLLLLVLYMSSVKKPEGLPPGIWGWPIIGVLPSTDVSLADQVLELRKKYGDIISWKTGSRIFIYLCDYKLIKTAFNRQDVVDRPGLYSLSSLTQLQDGGILSMSGQTWYNNRRFTLRQLKDLGMGKTHLGGAIENEASHLVEDFKKYLNHPTELPMSINISVLNVIWQMVASTRYDVDDKKAIALNQLTVDVGKGFEGPVIFLDIFPSLVPLIPFKLKSWLGMNAVYNNAKILNKFLKEEVIQNHLTNLDRDDPKDLIDAYILSMEEQKNDPESTMSLNDLSHMLTDLFGAGSLTTSVTIRWTILYLVLNPHVQERAHKEIDSVVPRDTLPSLEHKDSLSYTEALCLEAMRLSSLVPMGVAHTNVNEIELGGYRLPKNCVIIPHQECCNKDPVYWENPEEFNPEHFLDENGKVSSRKESFLPFSIGRRLCVGESLARMELFMFMSALLQNFTFLAPEGEKLTLEKNPAERLLSFPKPFKVVIKSRV